MFMARDHPKFNVPNYGRKKRVKSRWRKPRGVDSKKRVHKAKMGASPEIGWRSPRNDRDFHPSGKKEVLVRNLKDMTLTEDQKKTSVFRIARTIGKRKRAEMVKKAKELGVKILNEHKSA